MHMLEVSTGVHICKYLSHAFPLHNGLNQGATLSRLLFSLVLDCVIR